MSSQSLLTALLDLISTSTHTLQSELSAAHLPEPWIDHAKMHPWDEQTPSKTYWDARRVLIGALGMMTAVVQNPREKVLIEGMGYHHPAALNFVSHTGIADILAGPDVDESVGLPVAEIAKRANVHPGKLERILRFLCTYHMFQETSPSVFANNKLSICLKTESPGREVPVYWADVAFRSATAFSRTFRSPLTALSVAHDDAPFCEVFGQVGNTRNSKDDAKPTTTPTQWQNGECTDESLVGDHGLEVEHFTQPPATTTTTNGTLQTQKTEKPTTAPRAPRTTAFEFLALPESERYCAAFTDGMKSLEIMNGALGYFDFAWEKFDKEGAVIVEAGASSGHLSLAVLPAVKHARFVNQDRPEVCKEGEKFFAERAPEAIASGRVTFQPNDFFTGQPVKGAEVYILSNILHDWPDKEALNILSHIAQAMTPESRLLVIEVVIVPVISQSRSPPDTTPRDPNDPNPSAPWPLPKDFGMVNRYPNHQSMELLNLFNGLDRTLEEYTSLLTQSGLELVQLHRIRKLVSIMEVKLKD